MFTVEQRVRIKENAFAASDEPNDWKLRGQFGKIVEDQSKTYGPGWQDCWTVITDGGEEAYLSSDELDPV